MSILVALLLLVTTGLGVFVLSPDAASVPVGTCWQQGNIILTNSTLFQNLSCVHSGSVTLNDSGSITLVNSTINLDGSGSLFISGDSVVRLSGSDIINGSIFLSNNAQFYANESSFLGLTQLFTSNLATFETNSSIITINSGGNVSVSGSSFSLYNSTLNTLAPKTILVNANTNLFQNTLMTNQNITKLSIGNFSSDTTIQASTISNSNVAILGIGNTANTSLPSTTNLVSSRLFDSNVAKASIGGIGTGSILNVDSSVVNGSGTIEGDLRLFGGQAISIQNSSVENEIMSTSSAHSLLSLVGGNVTISNSNLISSDATSFGYAAPSNSILSISSTSNIEINGTTIVGGQVGLRGTCTTSLVTLDSAENTIIASSSLQSEALSNISLILTSRNPVTLLHSIIIQNSYLNSGTSPGNISIFSNYIVNLTNTMINGNSSTTTINTETLYSLNSVIPSSIVAGGGEISNAYLYNTTARSVEALPGGSLYSYSWLAVQVLGQTSQGNSSAMPNAKVTVLNAYYGATYSTSLTNGTGWTIVSLLSRVANSTSSLNITSYVVEASSGSLRSNQESAAATNSSTLTLSLGPVPNASNFTSSKSNYLTFPLQTGFGNPLSYIGIYTNAYPVNLLNNATFSEIDFETVGTNGYNFTFTIIYNRNMTTVPATVKVDGIPLKNVETQVNATDYFSTFSVSSGSHKVSISYISPNGNYIYQQYPNFNPSLAVILAVVLLGVVGIGFIFLYVWRQDKRVAGRVLNG